MSIVKGKGQYDEHASGMSTKLYKKCNLVPRLPTPLFYSSCKAEKKITGFYVNATIKC